MCNCEGFVDGTEVAFSDITGKGRIGLDWVLEIQGPPLSTLNYFLHLFHFVFPNAPSDSIQHSMNQSNLIRIQVMHRNEILVKNANAPFIDRIHDE